MTINDLRPITSGDTTGIKAAISLDANYDSITPLIDSGNDCRVALQALLNAAGNDGLTLPEGTYTIFGTATNIMLTMQAGCTLRGSGKGTVLKLKNPHATLTNALLSMASNCTLENITLQWDSTSPPVLAGESCLLCAIAADAITVRNVNVIGPAQTQNNFAGTCTNIALFDVTNSRIENTVSKWSSGTGYGCVLIGCQDIRIAGCAFIENAADGLKVFGDTTYGESTRIFVQDTNLDRNGQVVMQGQLSALGTYVTTATQLSALPHGSRIILNAGSNIVRLPATSGLTIGTQYLFSKVIPGSPVTTIVTLPSGSTDTITGGGAVSNAIQWDGVNISDRTCIRFTSKTGGWDADFFTNGQGYDGAASNVLFTHCSAIGNETAGFQVKTNDDATNTANNVSFLSCIANDSWAGSGFGIVATSGNAKAPIETIHFVNCLAKNNKFNGLIANCSIEYGSKSMITGISITNFTATGNAACGILLDSNCNDVTATNVRLYGNGTASTPTSAYNLQLLGTKNVLFDGLAMFGVDPTINACYTDAAIDAATPVCRGAYLQKDVTDVYGTYTMSNVILRGVVTRNHNGGNNVLYYTSTGVASDASGLSSVVHVDTVPLGVQQWYPGGTTTQGVNSIIGHPLYNIIEDRTSENLSLIGGGHLGFTNEILGTGSHRKIDGGYDNHMRPAISTYIYGSTHNVVSQSTKGHSFITGGGVNTMLTEAGEAASFVGATKCTAGGDHPLAITSEQSTVIGNYSTVSGSQGCTIGMQPDATKFGLVTSQTGFNTANPPKDAQMVVASTALGNVNDTITLVVCNSTGTTLLSNIPIECKITAKSSSTTLNLVWDTRGTHGYVPILTSGVSYVAKPMALSPGFNLIENALNSNIWYGSYNRLRGSNQKTTRHFVGSREPYFTDGWGKDCETNSGYQAAWGLGARPFNPGQKAFANGYFSTPGDMQFTQGLLMRASTTNATQTAMEVQIGYETSVWQAGVVYMPPSTLWKMRGEMIAQSGKTNVATWNWTATLRSNPGAGISEVTVMSFAFTDTYATAGTASTWTWTLNNGGQAFGTEATGGSAIYKFEPLVTGAAATNVRWELHAAALEMSGG